MKKKISEQDIKDWEKFVHGNEPIENKDLTKPKHQKISNLTIDLHGLTLDEANKKIYQFIEFSFDKNAEKITVITGKGLRSKVDQNPYQSKDLGILKYSVPDFIKSNTNLMLKIKRLDDQVHTKNSGFFTIYLKSKNKFR